MSEVIFLYTTWPDDKALTLFAEKAVKEKLAACVNILPGMLSVYEWDGKIQTDTEIVAIFKTTRSRAEALTSEIIASHPYDEPAIAGIDINPAGSSADFREWIKSQCEGL